MKRILMTLLVIAGLAGTVSAGAITTSSIQFQSLPGTNTGFTTGSDYVANWNKLVATYPDGAPGYGDAKVGIWDYPIQGDVDNHQLIKGGSYTDLAYHFQINFTADEGTYEFRIAPDFGFGGTVLLDGVEAAFHPKDMWWGLDWNNTSQLFTFSSELKAGKHVIDVYGQEACCDGPTGAQWRAKGGDFRAFGGAAVPEPSSLGLIGIAVSCAGAYGWLRTRGAKSVTV